MKIKRFFANTVRAAINNVRVELGADAVILSNRQVEGGFEIIAATEYDESLLFEESIPAAPSATNTTSNKDNIQNTNDNKAISAKQSSPHQTASSKKQSSIEWSQDPTLVQMRGELKSLRGILEHQLSGLAWGDFTRRSPSHARIISTFSAIGLEPELNNKISVEAIKSAVDQDDHTSILRSALGIFSNSIPVVEEDILSRSGAIALVGATGVGKTTMIAKLAARFILRHGARHVALVTTDNFRIGAHEQLKTYGRIMGIPVRTAANAEELRSILKDLSDKRLVLIDTAGVSQRDIRLSEQLATLNESGSLIHTYMVMSATTQMSGIDEVIDAHSDVKLDGCIISKLDESTSLGGAISMAIRHNLPIAYVGDGQRVPEDIHLARATNLVNRCMSILKQSGSGQDMDSLAEMFGDLVANAHG